METQRGLVRAAGSMGVMTGLSRIAGYIRDNLEARIVGAGASMDAFVIAWRIPNMLRRLVAEGALTSAFVPTFSGRMQRDDREALWRFAGSVLYALTVVLAAIVVLGIVFSPVLVRLLAWGFGRTAARFDLTVALNRLMFPYIFLISLAALMSGILNAFGRFSLPAFTPVLLNLSTISCGVLLARHFPDPTYGFAIGVLLGGILQLLVQVPPVLRRGLDLRPPRPFDWHGVREVGRLILPRIFGTGITQINILVDSNFAAALATGSVSFLYYAIRVTELTQGAFAISLSTVILPTLSRAAADGDRRGVRDTLSMAIRLLLLVTIPATVGIVLLRTPIIQVLFEYGRFTAADTAFTASALACYALGLLPYAAVNVLAAAFYAHRDTRTPVLVGALTFAVHLGLNFALRGPFRHNGIALSTALTAFLDAGILLWLLRRHAGPYLDRGIGRAALRSLAASAVMGAALASGLALVDVTALPGLGARVAALGALVIGGAAIYLGCAALLGSEEIALLRAAFLRRRP